MKEIIICEEKRKEIKRKRENGREERKREKKKTCTRFADV